MKKEIIINVDADETRAAVVENTQLVEFMVERASEQSIVGNCYRGRVSSILPGMQCAFIEMGLEKAGFLHVDDVLYDMLAGNPGGGAPAAPAPVEKAEEEAPKEMEEYSADVAPLENDYDEEEEAEDENAEMEAEAKAESQRRREMRGRFKGRKPGIQDLLKKGQEILVQVAKDPIGTKGPRLTTRLSLAGRSLVLMPLSNNVGVSRRISDSERGRMKGVVRRIKPHGMGIIIRTLASGEGEEELRFEVEALARRWGKIRKGFDSLRAPALLYKEEGLTDRILREMLSKDVEQIVVDNQDEYQLIVEYVEGFGLGKNVKVVNYRDPEPIFDHYDLEKEIEKALREKVWLRSGGYLIIQQTEALCVVDVNTGKFVGKRNQDDTIFRTNLEAAVEVARQLRLRDIGGIIVIDFIDMEIEDHKEKVYLALAEAIKRDKAKTNILQLTDLGLIEMTRKRVKQSLVKELCQPCPYCEGRGIIFSELSTALKILRLVKRASIRTQEKQMIILAHPAVSVHLTEDDSRRVRLVEADFKVQLQVRDDFHMHREDFKILSARSMAEIRIPE